MTAMDAYHPAWWTESTVAYLASRMLADGQDPATVVAFLQRHIAVVK